MSSKRGKKPRPDEASRADKYDLYQRSVQAPEHEVGMFVRFYKDAYGGVPKVLREDFCGTAAICHSWVRRKPERRSYGVDLDPEPLIWGAEHNGGELTPKDRARVELVQGDVRTAKTPQADVLSAQNFSFYIFRTRQELLTYFKAAYKNLAKRGVFVLDMLGGPDVMTEYSEESRLVERSFTYVWEQCDWDPIDSSVEFRIHFRFKDGSELNDAFTYQWRLWTMPEVREALLEAGFSRADVYWEGADARGKGNGVYRKRTKGTPDAAWVAYVIGVK